MEKVNLLILEELQSQNETLKQILSCLMPLANAAQPTDLAARLQALLDRQEQRDVQMKCLVEHAAEIAANTKPLAAYELMTSKKIFKPEVLELLKISPRTYDRHKASGLLEPRGVSQDFYYPKDLEKAIAEGKRRGRI